MSKRVFAIVAHPDDIEFMMAGTLVLLKNAGYEIHMMNIANGSCGTTDQDVETIVRIRKEEAKKSADAIDAVYHEALVNDLEIFYEKSLLARIAAIFRQVAPEILLVQSPEEYMEDHMNSCRLAVSAAFCRGMPNFPTEPSQPVVNQEVAIYHSMPHGLCDGLGRRIQPEIFVDISSVIEKKQRMLAQHESQHAWLRKYQGMNSYIATMADFSRKVGQMSGRYELAEGWRRHSHLGFCSEGSNPLVTALGDKAFVLRGQAKLGLDVH